ncbi:MAG: coenzyme F420-0:L-glutamate ligase [Candidatus Acidiferrales bacterium]
MPETEIRIFAVQGIPEIQPGNDLGAIIADSMRQSGLQPAGSDVVVVAQKIVSKAEGQIVQLDSIEPSARAEAWAKEVRRDPRVIELALREAVRVVRMARGVLIVETHHGFVCANGGVDVSNTAPETAILLPKDSDRSAERLRMHFEQACGVSMGVIISDTFGRPWREGLVNVAIGASGIAPLVDYRGVRDSAGRTLQATVMAVADELASAAELVMGKTNGTPVALIRGFAQRGTEASARNLLRPANQDLFR